MELRETKALDAFDEHDGSIGDIDPYLYYSRRNQNINRIFETAHDSLFLLGFLSALEEANAKIGEYFILEPRVFCSSYFYFLEGFGCFYERQYDKGLSSFCYFFLYKSVDFFRAASVAATRVMMGFL